MGELVTSILLNIQKIGELDAIKMYDKGFTTIDFSNADSNFQITIIRKDKEENKDGHAL